LAPIAVALVIVVVAVTVVIGAVYVTLAGLGRHRSRTRDQTSTIFTLRTAVVALAQTSAQGWTGVDSSVRPAVVAQLPLIQDAELRHLTNQLLETTSRLAATTDPVGNTDLRGEVDALHERFRHRCNEVIRELKLGRVPRSR